MIYYTIPPSPILSRYVRMFWALEHDVAAGQPYIHRTMADGCPEMVFHYKGVFDELLPSGKIEKSFTSGISGQTQTFNRYQINRSFGIFGAYLYPYTIPCLFNIPATDISNQTPNLQELWGQQGKDLEERMMLADNNQQRASILSGFLEQRLIQHNKPQPPVFNAISHIIKTKGTTRIESLAKDYYLSTRQFERSFKQFAGFTPKLFSRLARFQSVIAQYGKSWQSLTHLAYDCGYYDQSHFIHDFKEFSGFHPSHYFTSITEGTEWKS